MKLGPILPGIPLFLFGALGAVATFSVRGMHNTCGTVRFPMISNHATLTEAECASILAGAVKHAPRGKENDAAVLIYALATIVRIEGVCFAMMMIGCWYTLFFVKFEHRYPVHLWLGAFCCCSLLVDGSIFGIVPFGHMDGPLPQGKLGEEMTAEVLNFVCLWSMMLPANIGAFIMSKAANGAKASKSA